MHHTNHWFVLLGLLVPAWGCSAGDTESLAGVEDAGRAVVELDSRSDALSTPGCSSTWSDRDRDGRGWENGRECTVEASTTRTTSRRQSRMDCSNPGGTPATMAALAVSAAMELRRWQPTIDFEVVGSQGPGVLALTDAGRARCADGVCAGTQAILEFQKDAASGKVDFPGNVQLDSGALRAQLVANFRKQQACEGRRRDGRDDSCPAEEHQLTFQHAERGGCDTEFFFLATRPDGRPLRYPAQLANKLIWVDRNNPYVAFESDGNIVSIDPTYGLNDTGATSSGACTAACVLVTKSKVAGNCCSCAGVNREYVQSSWNAETYLCM